MLTYRNSETNEYIWKSLFFACFVMPLAGNIPKMVVKVFLFIIWILFYNKRFTIKLVKSEYLKWFSAFLLYSFISIFWALDRKLALDVCIYMTSNLLMIIVVLDYARTKKRLLTVIDAFLMTEIVTLILCLATAPISYWGTGRFTDGIILQRNEVAMNAAMASAMALYAYYITRKWKYKLYYVFTLVLAVLPASRKSFLAAILVLLFYKILTSKDIYKFLVRLGQIAFIFIVGGVVFYSIPVLRENYWDRIMALTGFLGESTVIEDGSVLERKYFWSQALYMFTQKPILGWGINNFRAYLAYIGYGNAVFAHSDYAELLADVGVIGVFIYFFQMAKALLSAVINVVRQKEIELLSTIILAIFAFAGVGAITYYRPTYAAILSIVFAAYENSKKPESDIPTLKVKIMKKGRNV